MKLNLLDKEWIEEKQIGQLDMLLTNHMVYGIQKISYSNLGIEFTQLSISKTYPIFITIEFKWQDVWQSINK